MKTITGVEIPKTARGVLYICHLDTKENDLHVKIPIIFKSRVAALDAYSNIPNPESQLALGNTYEELKTELVSLHKRMKDKIWLKQLSETL